MSHQEIIDYNKGLIKCDARCDILEYINHINYMYKNPIDLSFMNELLSFVEQDACCIPHSLLIKYGVFKEKNASANIKSRLEDYGFIENEDFILLLEVQEKASTSRGAKHCNTYYLHPNAFKLMLMRSKCEKKYAKYYILLEKSINYYHDYQIRYKEYMLSQKDNKIIMLEQQIQELIGHSKETKKELNVTKDRLSDIEEELNETSDRLDTTIVDLSVMQDKLSISVEDRAIKPFDKNKVNQIGILKSNTDDTIFYLTCGQKSNVDRAIRLRHKTHSVIDMINNVPNSIYLFDHIKKQIEDNIKSSNRTIKLIKIDQFTFIDTIKSLFDGRRNIDLTTKP